MRPIEARSIHERDDVPRELLHTLALMAACAAACSALVVGEHRVLSRKPGEELRTRLRAGALTGRHHDGRALSGDVIKNFRFSNLGHRHSPIS